MEYLDHNYHNKELNQTHPSISPIYFLPKLHKLESIENINLESDIFLRPVVPTFNSPTALIAQILHENLKNCIPTPLSHIKNSYHFFKKIDKTQIPNNHIMISLDVSSLFTNVPLNLVIESLDKNYHKIHNNCKLPFTEIIDAIKFLYNNTYVTFNSVIYTPL